MKRIILLLAACALLWLPDANAGGFSLGIKRASEFIAFPLHDALDSSGIPGRPDSVHILTYSDNLTAAAFTTRSTTYPFSDISLDTTKIYGDTTYWFVDQIQDIDGTAGNFELSIMVRLWFKKLATETFATVQVIDDSLNLRLANKNIADSVNAILDTLQDGAGGPTVQLSTAALASVGNRAADSVWGKPYSTGFTAGTMGDSLNNLSYVGGLTTALRAEIGKNAADSTWNKAFGTSFTAGTMGDSLNNESYVQNMSRVSMDATAADNFETMLDGTGGAVFSLRKLNINNTTTDDTAIIARGNGVAPGVAFIAGATGPYGMVGLGVGSSSAGIAGVGGTGASSTGIYGATTGGAGDGMKLSGGTTGDGLQATGGTSSGYGMTVTSVSSSAALNIAGSATGAGISVEGFPGASIRGADATGANGLLLVGDSTGNGLQVQSEQGDAIRASGASTTGNGHGMFLAGGGNKHGLFASGGSSAGDGANFTKGSGGQDLDADLGLKDSAYVGAADAINDSTIAATALVDSIWNEDSTGHYTSPNMAYTAAQTGAGASFTNANAAMVADSVWNKAYATAFGAGTIGDSLTNYTFVGGLTTAIQSALAKAAADSTWGKAFATAYPAGTMGDSLNNASYMSGAATVSTANMAAIADSVWNKAWGTGFTAGSMGDSLNNFTPLRAAAKSIFDSTATVVTVSRASADSTWNKAFGTSFTAGTMGDSLNNSSWVQGLINDAITAAKIAADAIGASEIAADALSSSELAAAAAQEIADQVWDEDTASHNSTNSFGYFNNGRNWPTVGQFVDSIWDEDSTGHYTSPNMAYVAAQTAASSGLNAADSALIMRLNKRTWGVAVGSGSDSLTATQRTVGAAASVTGAVGSVTGAVGSVTGAVTVGTINSNVITATSIATDAITSAKIAADAIGASELATDAIGATELAADAIGASELATDAITATEIAADAIGASELAATGVREIVDSVWQELKSEHTTAGTYGLFLDAAISGVSGGAGLDSATTSRIIRRTVWGAVAGSGADSVPAASRFVYPYAGLVNQVDAIGANGITATSIDVTAARELSDSVWAKPFNAGFPNGSMGDSLNNYSYVGGSDSAATSRIVKRTVWGIATGSGSDSSTTAQRVISSTGSVTITGADIAAIGKAAADSTWQKNFAGAGTVGGSIGDSLNNSSYVGGSGGGSGSGAYTVTVRVVDTSATPDSVLSNQVVTVNNAAQNGQTYTGVTNNNGQIQFNLDAGTYVRLTDAAGYAFDVDTFTVAGTRTDSLKLYKNTGDRKPISFRYDDPSGSPIREFSVALQLVMVNDSLPRLGDTALSANAGEVIRLTDLDRDGKINWHLLQNPRITNDSSFYVATFYRKNGSKLRGPEKFRVPSGTTVSEYFALTRWQN